MTDIELNKLLDELVGQPHELQWLEFKLNKGSINNDNIGEYISAMSNGATIANKPFGYLVWGVEDGSHKIVGTNFLFTTAKEGNQDLELWLRNLLFPRINFETFEFIYNHHHITLVRIPAAKAQPSHFRKIPYIRIRSNKTDLRNFPDLIRIIYNTQEDWSAKIVDKATIDDLDPEAIRVSKEKFRGKNSRADFADKIDSWDTITFLDRAKVTINGKITNTAIILLGHEESSHFLLPVIAQITWKLEGEEKGYEHFGSPMLLNTTKVMQQIRNIKYKFFPDNELLATTVNKYETRSILEALHNCIAHQDYSMHSRIIVAEKVDRLIFTNAGSFYEGSPDDYTGGEKTPERYRNPFLSQAMVNLGMIDTLGYGIHTMVLAQRNRYFPLPDYILSEPQKVTLLIYGHSIDENYSKLLIEQKDLPLTKVVLLDRVQKKLPITDEAASMLKKDNLIAGRKPNFYVEASIAAATDDKATYIKNRAFDDDHYKKMVLAYLKKFKSGTRQDFESLILEKLSNVLTDKQKKDKVRNLLQAMRRDGQIRLYGRNWELV
ncbi:MAG: putative DNA binding domain-containing protein [Bacteroidetes bacterium]|nr:putative DNA binding domain-containing protein [Bacteroidota bacterium]